MSKAACVLGNPWAAVLVTFPPGPPNISHGVLNLDFISQLVINTEYSFHVFDLRLSYFYDYNPLVYLTEFVIFIDFFNCSSLNLLKTSQRGTPSNRARDVIFDKIINILDIKVMYFK